MEAGCVFLKIVTKRLAQDAKPLEAAVDDLVSGSIQAFSLHYCSRASFVWCHKHHGFALKIALPLFGVDNLVGLKMLAESVPKDYLVGRASAA